MDRLSAEAIIRDRMTGQNGDSQMGEVVNGQLAPGVGITGWAFTIDTEFSLGTRTERGTEMIRLTGDPLRPYFVLYHRNAGIKARGKAFQIPLEKFQATENGNR